MLNKVNGCEQILDQYANDNTNENYREYQTADELFELMAKNHQYDSNGQSLSSTDLVMLYRNIEMGTKLMTGAETLSLSKSNQYVEAVVYNSPDSDSSNSSEIYTSDDLYDVVLFNKERIDFLSDQSSVQNTLCNKLGDLNMPAPNVSFNQDKRFLFNDPYIKKQLTNYDIILNSTPDEFVGPLLSASLLDYICCKRLDNNYDFYMDNIIKYVQHTIEQLKRISNGDYLSDKAKEKWTELKYADNKYNDFENNKILPTSTSIPLQVDQKIKFSYSTWDDIIHSEVNVRSVCKILQKKLVIEIPKLIQGSHKLFSKFHPENLILRCKNRKESRSNLNESRIDVVLHLDHSETEQVSNISSVMIWQSNPQIQQNESTTTALIPLLYNQNSEEAKEDQQLDKIVEIEDVKEEIAPKLKNFTDFSEISDQLDLEVTDTYNIESDSNDDDFNLNTIFSPSNDSVQTRDLDTGVLVNVIQQSFSNTIKSSDVLAFYTKSFNMDSLPEESCEEVRKPTKTRSSTKTRIKSPYENKSILMEEKKRKRLLEIRERREKKKIAMSESCKIFKHKYGKGSIMPRPSSSVTKLSITNKSFYNSIYGQNAKDADMQTNKSKSSNEGKDIKIENNFGSASDILSLDTNNKKYIDRSYYLDETVTEIMYTEPSENSSDVRELFSVSASVLSSDLGPNISSTAPTINSTGDRSERFYETNKLDDISEKNGNKVNATSLRSIRPNEPLESQRNYHKKAIPIECRKSIDKIYGLIKKLSNDPMGSESSQSKCITSDINNIKTNVASESSPQYSDSGTSLNHHLASSNPSSFNIDKIPTTDVSLLKNDKDIKNKGAVNVAKVIINVKQSAIKMERDNVKKERKKNFENDKTMSENPLKAISQFLHDIDSVQKTRHKNAALSKSNKKAEVSFEHRNISPQSTLKYRSRYETSDVTKHEQSNEKNKAIIRERKVKPNVVYEPLKTFQLLPKEERQIDCSKKRLADIIDEVNEAKGEAVRGPSKFTSRLNTLAQPKKSYVQAHREEYQTKYGKTLMANRLQRLPGTHAPMQTSERQSMSVSARGRSRRNLEPVGTTASKSPQPPSLPPLAQEAKQRRSTSASPEKPAAPNAPLYKQSHDPDASETLKDKMVAVESYVKSHYGRAVSANGDYARMAIKARLPLVPRRNLDFSPVPSSPIEEESAAIGNKLQYIINSIIKEKPRMLSPLTESPESDSKHSQKDEFNDVVYHSRDENPSSIDSEYWADIFKDKIVKTAVQNVLEDNCEHAAEETSESSDAFKCDIAEIPAFTTGSEELENSLIQQITIGDFSKRLRIKKSTMIPRQSVQTNYLAQSGDAGPGLLMQSTISKKMKVNISQTNSEIILEEIPSLVQPKLGWKVTSIPVQITTVAYTFPQYDIAKCGSNLDIKVNKTLDDDANHRHKSLGETDSWQDRVINRCDGISTDIDEETSKLEQPLNKLSTAIKTTNEISEDGVFPETLKSVKNSIDQVQNGESDIQHINYTSSLDMLVGILNEIQKITACHISSTCANRECKQSENVLDDGNSIDYTTNNNRSQDLISITSLNRLRQLDSNLSICSLYILKDDYEKEIPKLKSNVTIALRNERSKYSDKEVSADFPVKQLTSTLTDVPSFFPITVTRTTNITDLPMRIIAKPSDQTITYTEIENSRECSLDRHIKVIEIPPQTGIKKTIQYSTVSTGITNVSKIAQTAFNKRKHIQDTQIDLDVISFKTNKSLLEIRYDNISNSDPLIKIKRDILVTVYSLLVLTVFAAISLPDILYYA